MHQKVQDIVAPKVYEKRKRSDSPKGEVRGTHLQAINNQIFALPPEVDTIRLLQGKLEVLLAARAPRVSAFVLTPQPYADMSGVGVRDVAAGQMSGAASRTGDSFGMSQLLDAAPLSAVEPSHARS